MPRTTKPTTADERHMWLHWGLPDVEEDMFTDCGGPGAPLDRLLDDADERDRFKAERDALVVVLAFEYDRKRDKWAEWWSGIVRSNVPEPTKAQLATVRALLEVDHE